MTGVAAGVAALPDSRSRPLLDRAAPIVLFADEWGGLGGTAGYLLMLARGFRSRGYRVAAICHSTETASALRQQLQELGVEVRVLEADEDSSVRGHVRRLLELRNLLLEYPGCVLVLVMGYFTRGGAAIVAGSLAGVAGILRADLQPPEPPFRRRQGLALKAKDLLVDQVVVGATENIEAFRSKLGRSVGKLSVINTGIELSRFEPDLEVLAARRELRLPEDALIVGTLSRLDDERKGIRDFLAMAKALRTRDHRAHFLIVGDGVLRPELERLASSLGIAQDVSFAGWRRDVAAAYAAMDVFAMCSHFEGGPTTILEAMAMAKAVVATSIGMVPEVISHGTSGLIVPPGDIGALTEAVASLLDDQSLRARLGAAARTAALLGFSSDLMVERYLEAFADVIAKPRRIRLALPSRAPVEVSSKS